MLYPKHPIPREGISNFIKTHSLQGVNSLQGETVTKNKRMPLDLAVMRKEAASILSFLVSVDTSRGAEIILACYLRRVLENSGLAARIYEPFPGRGSLVACLTGGSKPPLVLLSHLDTAPAAEADWPFPPFPAFSEAVQDNEICGRGAIDCKGLATVHLLVFLTLSRLGVKLDRDIYLVSAAGEEEGGHVGTGWLLNHLPPLRQAEYVLGEGGGFTLETREGLFQLCQIGEKGKLRLSLKTTLPKKQLATLARATLERLKANFCLPLAPGLTEKLDMESIRTNRFHIQDSEITFEILPRVNVEHCFQEFAKELAQKDPQALITIKDRAPGTSSSTDTPLYTALKRETGKLHEARLAPFITPGYSDNRYFRALGAAVYGFQPLLPGHNPGWIHGTGERIGLSSLTFGVEVLFTTIMTAFGQ